MEFDKWESYDLACCAYFQFLYTTDLEFMQNTTDLESIKPANCFNMNLYSIVGLSQIHNQLDSFGDY